MTTEERVICEAYTGMQFCNEEELADFQAYVEKMMGRPVSAHEMNSDLKCKMHELSTKDFNRVILRQDEAAKKDEEYVEYVLTVRLPSRRSGCDGCPLCIDDRICTGQEGEKRDLMKTTERPSGWCPIRHMPETRQAYDGSAVDSFFDAGWNACIKMIKGGSNQ